MLIVACARAVSLRQRRQQSVAAEGLVQDARLLDRRAQQCQVDLACQQCD